LSQLNDGFTIGPVAPGTSGPFPVLGGLYALAVVGSTAAQLNAIGPDGSTSVPIGAAVTTNVYQQPLYLSPGSVKFVNTTGASVFAALSRIKWS
jgi:hypothetical protein